ncbi:MAG: DNA topoisomerase [Clostridium sp.]|nr:DNA topoisomerase [Clostridium sp.]
MIAIITEKPSVGMDIARVVGADTRKDGYCAGNGYMVTWALGHLVSLAMPGAYGNARSDSSGLPVIPDSFKLVVRQTRTDRGMVTDLAAARQLKVIDEVFSKCDSIIVATDAGREGELIFRYIYSYLGYTKPFRRLWISSLTDDAIREGIANLRDGREYDSLHAAADCRAKADWLVGMNASRALACVSGISNSSIGRVQTPTLAMVCARFKENRNFVPVPYWRLHVTLSADSGHRRFFHRDDFHDKASADAAFSSIAPGAVARVTKVERRRSDRQPPLLYDLTSLQKDCNVHHDMTAEKTLAVAQSLYEKKLISYPRTGSRYIPRDVMRAVPALLEKVCRMDGFRHTETSLDPDTLNTRCVNDAGVTDHHALIVTGVTPVGLSGDEQTVYLMIAGRMLEAFSPPCTSETLLMEAEICGIPFRSRSSSIVVPGWRAVFGRREDREDDETDDSDSSAVFSEGDTSNNSTHRKRIEIDRDK